MSTAGYIKITQAIVDHLLAQNERSGGKTACRYRSYSHGKKLSCAIGSILPDNLYTGDLEGRSVQSLLSISPIREALLKPFGIPDIPKNRVIHNLLTMLQQIHDYVAVEEWPNMLDRVMKFMKLLNSQDAVFLPDPETVSRTGCIIKMANRQVTGCLTRPNDEWVFHVFEEALA